MDGPAKGGEHLKMIGLGIILGLAAKNVAETSVFCHWAKTIRRCTKTGGV